jgi:hypothetical protein
MLQPAQTPLNDTGLLCGQWSIKVCSVYPYHKIRK